MFLTISRRKKKNPILKKKSILNFYHTLLVAGCAGVHGHVEANRLGVGVGREKREAHAGWRDEKGCRGTRRILSSRVVCVDHGGRGRGGNPLAKVGLLMISVVVVAVVVVASVVVAVVVVSSVVVAVVVVLSPL